MNNTNNEFSTIPNDFAMHYDSSVIESPDWITIPEAAKLLELGDRQTRNKCKEFNWQKRYAKVEGRPVAYLLKSDVVEYCRKRGPFMTPDEGVLIGENKDHATSSTTKSHPETPHDTSIKIYKNTPDEIVSILNNIENKLSPQISTFVETHKKVIEELTSIQHQNAQNEKQVTFWRTSLFWLIGISVLTSSALGYLWINTNKRAGELNQSYGNLNSSLMATQKELYESKLQISQKENELLLLKHSLNSIETVGAVSSIIK